MRNRTSDLRIPRSYALPLSHRDSLVSKTQISFCRAFVQCQTYEAHPNRLAVTFNIFFLPKIDIKKSVKGDVICVSVFE